MLLDLENLREDYKKESLNISEVAANPNIQFKQWFEEAQKGQVQEPNAMILSTSTKDGKPSSRTVLLKGFDETGFIFYSNYESKKAREILENPFVSLLFLWLPLQRQVRIEGIVERLDPEASTRYFQSRPIDSQIGAWASPQSQVIDDRKVLEKAVEQLQEKYKDQKVLPRPDSWGGYIVKPNLLEFWQGRSSRLHDRIQYRLEEDKWLIERLAP